MIENFRMAEVARQAVENTEQALLVGKNMQQRHFSHFTTNKKYSVMGERVKLTRNKTVRMSGDVGIDMI